MDITEWRTWATDSLRVEAIPDEVWDFVEKRRFVAENMDDQEKKSLLEVIRDLRTLYGGRSQAARQPPSRFEFVEDALSPYVQKRVQATTLLGDVPEDHLPVAVTGTIEDGWISVSAEPWVPARDFQRYYRVLQNLVFDGRRVRPMKTETLKMFRWTTQRRHENADETWDATRRAWNRSHSRHYSETSNLHRDYHRTKKSIDEVKRKTRKLDFRF